jgi:murein tripeptide amidase MpaA
VNEDADEFGYASQLLDKFDWYFVPLLNPDGYEYSRTNVSIILTFSFI